MTDMRIVVGSGPAAIGVTHSLLQRGFEVTMLDAGEKLDTETAQVVSEMASQEPWQWSAENKNIVQRVDFRNAPAYAPKRLFGSDYAYFIDPKLNAPAGMKLYGSRSLGGLSVLWGCALLRAAPSELSSWPASVSDEIARAYLEVRDLLQPSIGADIFAPGTHLQISKAAMAVWDKHRNFRPDGIDVYPTPLTISTKCKACNACMYGCVYGHTYSSRTTLEEVLLRNPRFRYVGGVIVEGFEETPAGIQIKAKLSEGVVLETFRAKQLFLAAGMMASLRIIWSSSSRVSRSLQAKDVSAFLIPGITLSGAWNAGSKHHGLSHLSVDLTAGPFREKPANVQLYFNNPATADRLKAALGFLGNRATSWLVDFANRFVVAGQGYLHSDFGDRIQLDYDDDGVITASVLKNPKNREFITIALTEFVRKMRGLGVHFAKPAASIAATGGSKTAGALPHALHATPTTTDALGRIFGTNNVFVVDMTVMNSIPARNHTLTMFANALRIGQSA
jgi:hypothetical protein